MKQLLGSRCFCRIFWSGRKGVLVGLGNAGEEKMMGRENEVDKDVG
jgi:hypothetical protein